MVKTASDLLKLWCPGRIRTCGTGYCKGSFPSVPVTHRKRPPARHFHTPAIWYLPAVSQRFPSLTMNKRWVGVPAAGAPVTAVCIKPRTVQTVCLALIGPPGRLLCQLWDHPGVAAGFPVARPPYWPDELPGSVGVWPDALADDFRTHASFQGAGCV